MIEYKTGNIFTQNTEAIVNAVNCVGVMGKGIALQFKNNFPENFRKYAAACRCNVVQLGKMFVFEINKPFNPKYIINFPTKYHWRDKSNIRDIGSGLKSLSVVITNLNIKSISIPALGCGLGGLNWIQVKSYIEQILKNLDSIQITVLNNKRRFL